MALKVRHHHADAAWLHWLKARQAGAIAMITRRFWIVSGVLALLTIGAGAALPFLGTSFMPDFREGHFVIQASSSVPGTSLDEMLAVGKRISADILKLPYVATVEQQVGRAALGEDTWGPHRSEFHVELKANADIDQGEAQDALRRIMAKYPGLQTEVVTFLGDRISESLTGDTADIDVKVFGDQLGTLDTTARRIVAALNGTPGIVDLQFKPQSGTPTLNMELIPDALTAAGLKSQDVLDAVQTDFSGTTVGQTYAGVRSIDVVLRLPENQRNRPDMLSSLMIASPTGPIPLSQLARITPTDTRYSIQHDGGQRYVAITFNVEGRSMDAVVKEAQSRIAAQVKLPSGVYVQFTGAAAEAAAARQQMLLYTAFALVLIGMILFVSFDWRANTWLVLVNMPFSLIGSVAAIAALGQGLTLGAMVGLVTVFGISARNAILLLAHYEHLFHEEHAPWNADTVLRGAQERLVPILMTAAVTALGLMPLALGLNAPGQEIEGPMAVTVLGGLFSSTLLNLIVLPALAARFGGPKDDDDCKEAEALA
jgi:Cu/Ag efflux pump CusA